MGIVASYCCWCFPREDKPNYQEEVSSPDSKFRSHHDPPSPPVKEPNDGLDGSAAAAGDGSKKEADKASQNPPVFVYKNGDGGATDACNSDNRKASPDGVCGSKGNRKVSHTMKGEAAPALKMMTRPGGNDQPAAAAANNRQGGCRDDHVGEIEDKY